MANQEALFSARFGPIYRLPNAVPAIQASFAQDGHTEMGALIHLPEGAEVTFCGKGFNDLTVKARSAGQLYFLFVQDLVPASASVEAEVPRTTTDVPRKPGRPARAKTLTASHVA